MFKKKKTLNKKYTRLNYYSRFNSFSNIYANISFISVCVFREYDPDDTMTSRFGKTYSRKAGDTTSKFDEVLSSRRGTLSTKWGATTYKAKVGSKRTGAPNSDWIQEVSKRPCPSADGLDDPFGFDSDDESKPVSSRSGTKASPAKPASAEPPLAQRPGSAVDTANWASLQEWTDNSGSTPGASWLNSQKNESGVVDAGVFFNSSSRANIGNTSALTRAL